MLPKNVRDKSNINASCLCLFFGLLMFALPVFAQQSGGQPAPASIGSQINSLSPETILANIQNTIPQLMRMITAFAYIIGFYMVIQGVMKLKHVGEMRTQMSHEHHLTGPILHIAIGALLIYLPSSVQVGLSTFWTNPNPYGYIIQQDQWEQFMNVCFVVIQFIGVLSFIRGLIMLSHVGSGGQHGVLGRGLTHIIGGIFCINIYQFIQVILVTVGIQT